MPHDTGERLSGPPLALIVDSNAAAVEELAGAIRQEGYAVLKALTFEEGKEHWRNRRPDILVVDIRLGQYNGLQLLMRARYDRPDLTAVVTSPVGDTVLEAEAIQWGATFLIKPVDRAHLLNVIRSACPLPAQLPLPETLYNCRAQIDRRQLVIPDYQPERRIAQRRSTVRFQR